MQPNSDLIELLAALNAAGADYLLVGAYALAFHGYPRATKDADILIGTNPDNARKVWDALVAFGAPLSELSIEDLSTPNTFFVMGRPPTQIDIITTIDGVTFEEAWAKRIPRTFASTAVNVIGRTELIANKRESGRPQDIADVAILESGVDDERGARR
jgi:hypothetical protein